MAVVLFALMHQARAWELDQNIPSVVSCIEANLRLPLPLLVLALGPLLVYYVISLFGTETPPPLISFLGISMVCYFFATGIVSLVAIISSTIFQTASFFQVFFKLRCECTRNSSSGTFICKSNIIIGQVEQHMPFDLYLWTQSAMEVLESSCFKA